MKNQEFAVIFNVDTMLPLPVIFLQQAEAALGFSVYGDPAKDRVEGDKLAYPLDLAQEITGFLKSQHPQINTVLVMVRPHLHE